MKIRNGFVSNSSSSSFIIQKNNKFTDTVSVAYNMIKDKFKQYESYHDEEHPKKRFVYNILKMLKDTKSNPPIMFISTNYDTYIIDLGDYIHISTCNNITWDIENLALNHLPYSLKEKYGNNIRFYNSSEVYLDNEIEEEKKFIFDDIKYFKIDSGFFIQRLKKYESCKTCYNELFLFNEQKICLNCDSDKILRYLKINKIKNK